MDATDKTMATGSEETDQPAQVAFYHQYNVMKARRYAYMQLMNGVMLLGIYIGSQFMDRQIRPLESPRANAVCAASAYGSILFVAAAVVGILSVRTKSFLSVRAYFGLSVTAGLVALPHIICSGRFVSMLMATFTGETDSPTTDDAEMVMQVGPTTAAGTTMHGEGYAEDAHRGRVSGWNLLLVMFLIGICEVISAGMAAALCANVMFKNNEPARPLPPIYQPANTGGSMVPMQPMGNQPQQPMGFQPQQPMGFQPQQPMGFQPQQPMGFQPQQPMGFQPQQPMGFQPQQPMGFQPQQPMEFQASAAPPMDYQPASDTPLLPPPSYEESVQQANYKPTPNI